MGEKRTNTKFFWSIFSRIWTEIYGDLRRFTESEAQYSVRIRENTDQKTPYSDIIRAS